MSHLINPVHDTDDNHKSTFLVQHRGKCEQHVRALHSIQAPCRVTDHDLTYVEVCVAFTQTTCRINLKNVTLFIKMLVHAVRCAMWARLADIWHIASRNTDTGLDLHLVAQVSGKKDVVVVLKPTKGVSYSTTLEASHIREFKPFINTQCKMMTTIPGKQESILYFPRLSI